MRKLLIVLFSLVYSVNGAWAADDFILMKTCAALPGTEAVAGRSYECFYRKDLSTGTETYLNGIVASGPGSAYFDDNGWNSFTDMKYLSSNQSAKNFNDDVNGKIYLFDTNENSFLIYDYVNNTFDQKSAGAVNASFAVPGGMMSVIKAGTDTEGNATTVVASSNIVDSNGKTIIETKADGSTHIGENSLVTIESGGKQQLYATNSSGDQIDINIKSGTNFLINGTNVLSSINTNTVSIKQNTQDIHGSVALSSAMSALPNSSEDAASTCGMGTGFHKGLSAISAGCAMDFATLTQNSNLSPLFKRASVNLGTSAIMNNKGFSNFALRAGLTFKLGAKKSSYSTLSMDEDLQRYSTGTNIRIADLKKENDILRVEMDALNEKLDALIASLNNG